ncbi:E3 ubiquitin-protein ligase RNF144A-like isoform X2 [Asparagus officinalis]|uniref:E3 ubiquitin-protein ligase RNF144A-like isoform X2 n=1 Tax=Asparagus officinalis TaxID=4686 RepID=UPI00098E8368|nr:E3 ubiquitin-protein ligase RNF144A-like isoform X2 [Asparagus officinalis]
MATMHLNLNNPPLIIEEDMRAVKIEEGTRNSPIIVAPFRNGDQGSKIEPICLDVEDEVEIVGDSKNPISVDDYFLLDLDCIEVETIDRKGKKPKRESKRRSIEIGESSTPPPADPDAYCSICMEPKFKYECFSLKNCSHLYCSACVSQYIEAKVEENVTSIMCPDPSCSDGYLEPEMCRSILKPEVFNRWGNALCEAMIGAMKFYCPFKDCSALLIDERGGEVIKQSECPHCFRLFCAQCKVPWHTGVNCEDFAKLGMAKKSNWQRCPKCKFYVEKVDGCMFIKCRSTF